jgi:phospholipid/cholesterol/gamma-HCH transport system substrate-binding protein
MSDRKKGTEVYVGLFLVIGFGILAYMVVLFGKTGERSQASYKLVAEFPNASGLARGASVLLSGADIGRVASGPDLEPGTYRITATLAIRADVKLPRQTKFVIGSTGLLGDKFVDVQLPAKFTLDDPLKDGEAISPSKSGTGGLSELTDKGAVVMDKLVTELEHIEALTARLNEGLLHERNLKNIEQTFENLKLTTDNFRQASLSLEEVVSKAGSLIETTQGTVKTADATAGELQIAIGDLRKMIASATKAVDTTAGLAKKAADGEGALGVLINDKKMAEDLKALAGNLRRTGVLFYKDKPVAATPAATPKPRR